VPQVFGHYGWRRACCGLRDALSVDHVNGGSSAHREELFGEMPEGYDMYRWLRDNGFPEGFQILCLSCNDSKGTARVARCATPQPEQ
jgi:hypothetical protein